MATEEKKEEENTKLATTGLDLVSILGEKSTYLNNYERAMNMALKLAAVYIKSAIGKGQNEGDIAYKLLKAYEMNIPMTQGLECIYIIPTWNGAVSTISAQMMYGMILARCKNGRIYIDELSNTVCRIKVKRDIADPHENFLPISMTIEEAKKKSYVWTKEGKDKAKAEKIDLSKLPNEFLKDNWLNSPDSMLFSRCISRASRWRFADIIGNLYVKEVIEDIKDSKELDSEIYLHKKQEIDFNDNDLPKIAKKEEKQPEITTEIVPADIIDLINKVCEKKGVKSEDIRNAIEFSFSVYKTENPNADKYDFIRNYLNKKLEDNPVKPAEKTEDKTDNQKTERQKDAQKKKSNANGLLPYQ